VVGAMSVAGPRAPKCRGKDDHGQEKEDASDFEPQDAAYAAKRSQKSAHAAGDTPSNLAGRLTRGPARCPILPGGVDSRLGHRGTCCGLCVRRCALAGDAAGNSQADPKSAANGVRFHFDMMVAANLTAPLFVVSRSFAVAHRRRRK